MKKILLLAQNKNDKNNQDIVDTCKNEGFKINWCEYRDLNYQLRDKGLEISIKGDYLIDSHDVFVLRGAGVGRAYFPTHRYIIAKELLLRGKRVLNGEYYVKYMGSANKLVQQQVMLHSRINAIPSDLIGSVLDLDLLPEMPFVAKPIVGSQGKGVMKVTTKTGVAVAYTHNSAHEVLLQPVLSADYDYRVIVLGNRVLGAVKKQAGEGNFITNYSAGGMMEQVEVSNETNELALKAAKAFDLEYAGVDIMPDGNALKVLEVNAQAEFQGFKRATGVDVGEEIVKFIVKS